MILKRFYNTAISQASYLVGCAATGEAVVIDPNRDVESYIQAAAEEGLRITAVTETHIHADYLSGSRELADRTGARLFLSDEGTADWKYAFANQPNVTLVRDGDSIRVGNVRLDVRKTPGHTPEHISFVLTDEPASSQPLGAFTGDFVFVGDVGRPDLLERAAGIEGTMEAGGRQLFHSLRSFANAMPDSLLIWPGHGAGSACGKALGGVPVSSLGYEKAANWAFRYEDENEFVGAVLEGQPEPPKYFAMMKRLNKEGPAPSPAAPIRIGAHRLGELVASNAIVLDVRSAAESARGFVPGSMVLPAGKSFLTWAGSLLPYDKDLYLVAGDEAAAHAAAGELALIGLDRVKGWMGPDALRAYEQGGGTLATVGTATPSEIEAKGLPVVDVRRGYEYAAGHVPGAHSFPLAQLEANVDRIPRNGELVVHCAGGVRANIAASILCAAGIGNVRVIPGGFPEWQESGKPVEA